jgi:hypothetical protein
MAGIYKIDWKNVGENLLFWRWRTTKSGNKSKLLAYIEAIMSSIQVLSDKLNILDDQTDDFLKYTGQHKVLEEFLNDKYDSVQRRIYITENEIAGLDPVVMGISGDTISQPVVMGITGDTVAVPVAMALSTEVLGDNNFSVNIPSAVVYNEATLRAQLDNYVLAGKNYNIVIF